ncbi:hypothetical protein JCM10207_006736 [Rhodosporidiobolus poonsookiae]
MAPSTRNSSRLPGRNKGPGDASGASGGASGEACPTSSRSQKRPPTSDGEVDVGEAGKRARREKNSTSASDEKTPEAESVDLRAEIDRLRAEIDVLRADKAKLMGQVERNQRKAQVMDYELSQLLQSFKATPDLTLREFLPRLRLLETPFTSSRARTSTHRPESQTNAYKTINAVSTGDFSPETVFPWRDLERVRYRGCLAYFDQHIQPRYLRMTLEELRCDVEVWPTLERLLTHLSPSSTEQDEQQEVHAEAAAIGLHAAASSLTALLALVRKPDAEHVGCSSYDRKKLGEFTPDFGIYDLHCTKVLLVESKRKEPVRGKSEEDHHGDGLLDLPTRAQILYNNSPSRIVKLSQFHGGANDDKKVSDDLSLVGKNLHAMLYASGGQCLTTFSGDSEGGFMMSMQPLFDNEPHTESSRPPLIRRFPTYILVIGHNFRYTDPYRFLSFYYSFLPIETAVLGMADSLSSDSTFKEEVESSLPHSLYPPEKKDVRLWFPRPASVDEGEINTSQDSDDKDDHNDDGEGEGGTNGEGSGGGSDTSGREPDSGNDADKKHGEEEERHGESDDDDDRPRQSDEEPEHDRIGTEEADAVETDGFSTPQRVELLQASTLILNEPASPPRILSRAAIFSSPSPTLTTSPTFPHPNNTRLPLSPGPSGWGADPPTSPSLALAVEPDLLGRGRNGTVRKAVSPDGLELALKYAAPTSEAEEELNHEVEVYHHLARYAPEIVPTCFGLFRVHDPVKTTVLVLERFGSVVKSLTELSRQDRLLVLHRYCQLHKAGYAHGDVAERNILFDERTRDVKLIDFGRSRKHECSGSPMECEMLFGTKLWLEI